ncbi:hypothetical protein HCN51_55070 [Nonomuraea sp. FMUSA5-5]|uniref:Uncharacterized protein n=1 Tax=Nonomuraea composti TaxID=2720023 RepID=A0ABX1BL33_9ACTN|nr:hypothetical protein [Nonomuraea sp. FMUSA5-5]NJP98453.1 hypothetical protein [Nonomuraea sp. FMUSA5-5]
MTYEQLPLFEVPVTSIADATEVVEELTEDDPRARAVWHARHLFDALGLPCDDDSTRQRQARRTHRRTPPPLSARSTTSDQRKGLDQAGSLAFCKRHGVTPGRNAKAVPDRDLGVSRSEQRHSDGPPNGSRIETDSESKPHEVAFTRQNMEVVEQALNHTCFCRPSLRLSSTPSPRSTFEPSACPRRLLLGPRGS